MKTPPQQEGQSARKKGKVVVELCDCYSPRVEIWRLSDSNGFINPNHALGEVKESDLD